MWPDRSCRSPWDAPGIGTANICPSLSATGGGAHFSSFLSGVPGGVFVCGSCLGGGVRSRDSWAFGLSSVTSQDLHLSWNRGYSKSLGLHCMALLLPGCLPQARPSEASGPTLPSTQPYSCPSPISCLWYPKQILVLGLNRAEGQRAGTWGGTSSRLASPVLWAQLFGV